MLNCKAFFDSLGAHGVTHFAGVPDSLLKDFCAYVTDHAAPSRHVITANEGSAVGLAAGWHFATGTLPLVYMQNSGLGNTVNPLTSLADSDVYGVPMLVVVGWRGEPGVKDEPQHVKMGRVSPGLLDALELPWAALPGTLEEAREVLATAVASARERQAPYALLVPKGTFEPYKLQAKAEAPYPMSREAAIARVVEAFPQDVLVVATTGKPSRELFEIREARGESHSTDFLTVGSMGHASQIALGVALEQPERTVVCLDGDGAAIMHLGGLTTIGSLGPTNYKHVLLNNGAHDSVGGQPTVAFQVDLPAAAAACGYPVALQVDSEDALVEALPGFFAAEGPALLEIRVKAGARKDLGRPTMTPGDLKREFMGCMSR